MNLLLREVSQLQGGTRRESKCHPRKASSLGIRELGWHVRLPCCTSWWTHLLAMTLSHLLSNENARLAGSFTLGNGIETQQLLCETIAWWQGSNRSRLQSLLWLRWVRSSFWIAQVLDEYIYLQDIFSILVSGLFSGFFFTASIFENFSDSAWGRIGKCSVFCQPASVRYCTTIWTLEILFYMTLGFIQIWINVKCFSSENMSCILCKICILW